MKTSAPDATPLKVLIVDRSADTQAVLSAALDQRGVSTLPASDAAEGLRHVNQGPPDCIVVDLESLSDNDDQALDFASAASRFSERLIVLGSLRRRSDPFAGGSFLPKPYHYGPLIRTIESLLQRKGQ